LFDYVQSEFHFGDATFELLCNGILLSRQAKEFPPSCKPNHGAIRIDVLRYYDPSSGEAVEEDVEVSDEDVDTQITDVEAVEDIQPYDEASPALSEQIRTCSTPEINAEERLVCLAEMFENLSLDMLKVAVETCTSMEDAIEAAMAMHVVAEEESLSTAPDPSTIPTSSNTEFVSSVPKRKRKKKKGGGHDPPPSYRCNVNVLQDLFPEVSKTEIEEILKQNNQNVDLAAEDLVLRGDEIDEILPHHPNVWGTAGPALTPGFPNHRKLSVSQPQSPTNSTCSLHSSPAMSQISLSDSKEMAEYLQTQCERTRFKKCKAHGMKSPHAHPNSYELLALGNPRIKRKEIKVHSHSKSDSSFPNRKVRNYRSEAAIKADTITLHPLPHHRKKSKMIDVQVESSSMSANQSMIRKDLDLLYAERATRFSQARKALKNGRIGNPRCKLGGQVAMTLAEEGHKLTDRIRELEKEQALSLIRERQSNAKPSPARNVGTHWFDESCPYHIDLHGLSVRQARMVTMDILSDWYAKETREQPRPTQPLCLVVGLGRHSAGIQRLGPAIQGVLRQEGYRFVDDSRTYGRFIVMDILRGTDNTSR
jgi:hypothetical protein